MASTNAEPMIDLVSGAFYGGDPHTGYTWMRRHDPVHFDERNGVWGVASYRHVREVSKDPSTFSNAGGIRPDSGPIPMMIDMDAPEHVRRRRLVSAGFTPRRVREMETEVRNVCDWIIDQVVESGTCDLVSDLAAPLPMIMIGNMLGVAPEDRAMLLRWSDDLLRALGSEDTELLMRSATAAEEYATYIHQVIDERRRTGDEGDLIGTLVHAEIDGDRLDADSLLHESLLILIGGDETTRHVISGGVLALLERPEQMEALRGDRSLLPTAVEEMLRWVSPIQNMCRTATRDTELGGKQISVGQKLMLLYPSANRDEAVFPDPFSFDVRRSPNDHVAFGFGAHFCLGNQLARLEISCMVDRILDRLPDLHRSEDGPVERRPANFVSGVEALPVSFTPGTRLGAPPS